MAARKIRFPLLVLFLFLGLLIGSAVGEALGVVLPDGALRSFLVEGIEYALGPFTLDLIVMTFTLGLSIDVNVTGALGVIAVAQALKWY